MVHRTPKPKPDHHEDGTTVRERSVKTQPATVNSLLTVIRRREQTTKVGLSCDYAVMSGGRWSTDLWCEPRVVGPLCRVEAVVVNGLVTPRIE